jgi:hypothetical protein
MVVSNNFQTNIIIIIIIIDDCQLTRLVRPFPDPLRARQASAKTLSIMMMDFNYSSTDYESHLHRSSFRSDALSVPVSTNEQNDIIIIMNYCMNFLLLTTNITKHFKN